MHETLKYGRSVVRDTMTDSMKEISHTPPHETSADAVWERGNEKSADEERPTDDADRTAAADD